MSRTEWQGAGIEDGGESEERLGVIGGRECSLGGFEAGGMWGEGTSEIAVRGRESASDVEAGARCFCAPEPCKEENTGA